MEPAELLLIAGHDGSVPVAPALAIRGLAEPRYGFPAYDASICGFSARWSRDDTDGAGRAPGDLGPVRTSYAVIWREGDTPPVAGRLELRPHALRLGDGSFVRELPYEELTAVRVGRSADERLEGRPSLVLERQVGEPVLIATILQPGVLPEIVERLAHLRPPATERPGRGRRSSEDARE